MMPIGGFTNDVMVFYNVVKVCRKLLKHFLKDIHVKDILTESNRKDM